MSHLGPSNHRQLEKLKIGVHGIKQFLRMIQGSHSDPYLVPLGYRSASTWLWFVLSRTFDELQAAHNIALLYLIKTSTLHFTRI